MTNLYDCEPKNLFSMFADLCAVPRGSGHTEKVVDYLCNFAAKYGLECEKDGFNNVIIRKGASSGYETAGGVILQAHHDMVCEKKPGVDMDFLNDPVRPVIEGDWIRADGTTLGGDDGIGVAMMLAILADDSLPHPALEMLFTADEEIGMPGAFGLDCSRLKGRKLINLDSEFEDVLMCSCAGGVNVYSTVPVSWKPCNGTVITVDFSGLKGGHSGVEIHKGRANAIVLMARFLTAAQSIAPVCLLSMKGGARETAIASSGTIRFITNQSDVTVEKLQELADAIRREYQTTEPGMTITITTENAGNSKAVSEADTLRLTRVLMSVPDGVQSMSADMAGLVQTSTNYGLIELKPDGLWFSNTVRSAVTSQKLWIVEKIKSIVALGGGFTETAGDYPGWGYNPNSVLKDSMIDVYKELFHKEPVVDAVHAGIECGLFADAIPGLDCVSYGPQMENVHTPEERLSISSSAKTYQVLCKTLEMLR